MSTNTSSLNHSESRTTLTGARKTKNPDGKSNTLQIAQDLTSFPSNYRENNHQLDTLVKNHRSEFLERFQERHVEGTEKISVPDLFIFLQECFYSDEILLMEKEADDHDFFRSINSYKRLLKIAENYFVNVKRLNPKSVNVKEELLSFSECFEVLDYWFQTDEDVLMISEAELERKKGGNQDVQKVLLDTIANYQKLVEESKSEVEKQVLQTTIDTLQRKLEELEENANYSPEREARKQKMLKNLKKKEEKRLKALREIFDFYSKQQLNGVKAPTFEKLERQTKSINLGKFSVILSNYLIKVDPLKLKEAFSKLTVSSEELSFEQFYLLFQRIAKDTELVSERKVVRPNPDIMKEYKPDSYKQAPVPQKPNSKFENRRMEHNIRQIKNEHFKVEDMWEHMGLYDGSYKENLQGLHLAFHLPEKDTMRVPATDRSKYRSPEQKAIDDLKEDIMKRNEMRREAREGRLIEKSLLQNFKESPQKTGKAERSSYKKEDSYAAIQANKFKTNLFDKKLTLKEIERSEYNEIKKMGIDGKFSPNDLIDENDEEDNFYLAEYHIQDEKQKAQEKQSQSVKKIKIPDASQSDSKAYNSKSSRSRGDVARYSNDSNMLLKSSTADDIEYGKKHQTPRGLGYVSEQGKRDVYQSVRSHKSPVDLRNIGAVSPHENKPMSQRYGEYVLQRAQQVQKEALRKEARVVNSLISIQNSKIEQGLRVARR